MTLDLTMLPSSGNIASLLAAYRDGSAHPREVAAFYLDRIARFNGELRAVIEVNPDALSYAASLGDSGDRQLPLFGVPILIKDNIETRDQPTTAGALAMAGSHTGRDAPLVTALRDAGAVILGKANLSEWANFKTSRSVSGWSDVGGQCVNPHDTSRNTSGSSSGSAVGVAAGLCLAAVGTETSGSVVCPASVNGLVGFKPTVGRISAECIVPISHNQDTAGPLTRCVADAAVMEGVMAGDLSLPEPADQPRIGAFLDARSPEDITALFNATLDQAAAAATVVTVDPADVDKKFGPHLFARLLHEFKADLNNYLANRPGNRPDSLEALIAFNEANPGELAHLGQDLLVQAQATEGLHSPDYVESNTWLKEHAPAALNAAFDEHHLTALATVTNCPAWPIDHAEGDAGKGIWMYSAPPAAAGFPHLTLPMGLVDGLPVGLSLIGRHGADRQLLALGARVEAAIGSTVPRNTYTSAYTNA